MKHDHHEYQLALFYVSSELDMPDRVLQPIRHIVDYSLGRIFWRDWLRSDEIDPEWVPTPGDHDDPAWHRVDGWPEQVGEYLHRKWSRRAQLWMQWHSVDAWHVVDWLVTARADGHAWLANVDNQGRPKKLMKCGSLDRLVHEATKGLRERNARLASDVVLGPNDEHFVHDLGAGHTLVRLRSRAALRKEGILLRHCIGRGSYDDILGDPEAVLASVRDPDGAPLATLEVRGGYIRQFRSRSNSEPSDAIKNLIAGAADRFGWRDWRDRPGSRADNPDYGPEAAVILRDLPPPRRRG
ncbi:PcfJ domain-containing protein [Rhizobium sp. AN80A]|uniref:PcfJ domain-containing protein n=1 Tax=Rhizobium sp. AN80A TaxID=3040673 RepID=UPI0024B36231|nr:PcfJ domain-containing protein [Rhizobium sp. AN80A]